MAAADPNQFVAAGAGQHPDPTKPQPAAANARPWSGTDTKLQPGPGRKPPIRRRGSQAVRRRQQTFGWGWKPGRKALIDCRRIEMTRAIYYCYDAYCGWCYGFSPVITRLFAEYRSTIAFEVLSGGMILPAAPQPIGVMAGYIR